MKISERLIEFFNKSESPILFAGAGISLRAGLATWNDLLKQLAEQIRPYDQLTRHIMLEKINDGELLLAASYYYMSNKIPEAEKYDILSKLLENYDSNSIVPLLCLPFKSIVTTNYDKALHDAYACKKETSPIEFSLGEPAFKSALFQEKFYIARIHGRAEFPESIVLSTEHYKKLEEERTYIDLLTNLFTRKQILFIGFSFLDPAIKNVLSTIYKHYGTVHKGRHLALLPDNASAELISELEKFSIEKVLYDTNDSHLELWDAILSTCETVSQQKLEFDFEISDPFAPAKQYLASCYARLKISKHIKPLRKCAIEGVVATLISRAGEQGTLEAEVINSVHIELGISKDESEGLVKDVITSLMNDSLCVKDGEKLFWNDDSTSAYESAIDKLIDSVLNRYVVREGGKITEESRVCVREVLNKIVLQRGWDLGASFATNRTPDVLNIEPIINSIDLCGNLTNEQITKLTRSYNNLFSSPSENEAILLSEMGRMAFALELILQSPHDALFHKLTLPEKIYLDANVLMPAITYGHPFYNIYNETINSLVDAATKSLIDLKVVVYEGFLNEIVSHRKKAIDEFDFYDGDGNAIKQMRKEVKLFGVHNLNVFIGAYLMLLNNNHELSFEQYLIKYAPYKNEKELEVWLVKNNFNVLHSGELISKSKEYPEILHSLEVAYANGLKRGSKRHLLVEHDARQMSAINYDVDKNIRSLFVTADKRLREKIEGSKYSELANNMVSHIGLIQLIDLLVGTESKDQIMGRLLWESNVSSESERVRNYLVDLALDEYDEASAMAMNQIIDNITEDVGYELEKKNLGNVEENIDKKEVIKIIGSYENRFFEEMRKLVEKSRGY